MILCEKPLARTAEEARPMVEAVEKAGVPNMVWYNYRRIPAVTLIKQVVDEGRLGRIFHYRANFLQDWTINPDVPQGGARARGGSTWRRRGPASPAICWRTASIRRCGSTGPIASLTAMTETFVKERKHAETGQVQAVGIDDAAAVLARYANGSLGIFESTRYARGHKALYTLEINGEHGSFRWDLHDLNRLEWFDHRVEGRLRGWTTIHVTDGEHPYLGNGGCRASSSAMSTPLCTRWRTSSRGSQTASRPARLSAMRWRPMWSATPFSSPGGPGSGWRLAADALRRGSRRTSRIRVCQCGRVREHAIRLKPWERLEFFRRIPRC
jgi:hypothetical protein